MHFIRGLIFGHGALPFESHYLQLHLTNLFTVASLLHGAKSAKEQGSVLVARIHPECQRLVGRNARQRGDHPGERGRIHAQLRVRVGQIGP